MKTKSIRVVVSAGLVILMGSLLASAQQVVATNTNVAVPPLVRFSGILNDVNGKPLAGVVGVTFLLYKDEQGGAPLWLETQNLTADKSGHYTVMLGSTSSEGLPTDLFASGEAHWLGVQAEGQAEQARVLLLSVPYALKAGDAQTLGGLPASAFVLAAPPTSGAAETSTASATAASNTSIVPATSSDVTTSGGTVNTLPLFSTATDIQNSLLTQTGTAAINVGGKLNLFATGTANASAGKNSQPLNLAASAYNSSTKAAVAQTFQLQAEPAANDTTTPSGTMNLLYGAGTSSPTETGLKINNKGQITFAAGQTFPGTGSGTITGVTAGNGLSGGGTSGSITLSSTGILSLTQGTGISIAGGQTPTIGINPSVVPQLTAKNTFTGNQTVNGNLSSTGVVTGGSFQIGSNLFAFGSYANENAFLGFGGNATMTGTENTAVGVFALKADTTGFDETAIGNGALYSNTTGRDNTASGVEALSSNSTGGFNTASGSGALSNNSTGSFNTASGYEALTSNTTSNQNTAIGFEALDISKSCCNTAVGYNALYDVSSGQANTGVGNGAGATVDHSVITGTNNTFLGTGTFLTTGTLTNSTAIGANAEVGVSNALVLGSISGVNGATASVNVGIGTTTPAAPLDIAAQSMHTYIGDPCSIAGAYAGIAFGNFAMNCSNYSLQGDGTNTYVNAPTGGAILFRINNKSGPSYMELDSSGNVGIGTGSPDALLSVNGSADKPGGGSWGTFSDRRLKTLDGNFNSGLSQILKINPVRYRYKEENAMGIHDPEQHVGLVAQDVQKVIPEAVTENTKGYLLVNNDPIIWAMLNAIKEQQREIATLRTQLRRRAAKDALLESRLAALERDGAKATRLASARPAP